MNMEVFRKWKRIYNKMTKEVKPLHHGAMCLLIKIWNNNNEQQFRIIHGIEIVD